MDIINPENNSVQNKISGLKGVYGIAFAPEFNKGFISDGHDNSIVVFNLKNFKIIKTIKSTGGLKYLIFNFIFFNTIVFGNNIRFIEN